MKRLIAEELSKILSLQDKLYRTNGASLLSDAKGANDNEELAVNHINEVLGFSGTKQSWGKKLLSNYQALNPADKKLFDSEYNKLKKAILDGDNQFNFALPLSTDPKAAKSILMKPDF